MGGQKTTAPHGSWPSPISAQQIAGATIRLGQTAIFGDTIVWSEGRPLEQGRNVLVRRDADGTLHDLNPAPFNARSRAHEYGGGAFLLLADASVVFSHDDDQQLYLLAPGATAPRRLTSEAQMRYANAVHDAPRARLIAVREDHRHGDIDAVTTLVAIDLADGTPRVLAGGHDFFSSPCLSPDGKQLAWLSWDHPDMPWDASTLWLADVQADGSLANMSRIAGGRGEHGDGDGESIFQPSWSPQGELHFVSDRSGWWNLYRLRDAEVQPLHPMAAEFGVPQWAFGMSTYGFDERGRIVCCVVRNAAATLALLDPQTGALDEIATPFNSIEELRVGAGFAVFLGASPTDPEAVIRLDLASGAWQPLRSTSTAQPDPDFVSVAEPIAYPSGGSIAHAFFYRPANRDTAAAVGELPPLLVVSHGGPTGSTDASFKWSFQYWTSRGFAIVDVNYRGSTGYGTAYRRALDGQWGVVDVDDSIAAARFLIERGDVDPQRIAIRGASAGGFTTLAALTFHRFFKAGASHYGIGDLEALAKDTHKFESRYLDRLVGPYPQEQARYIERSPIRHIERLASPMILFQGSEDKAVPPDQARAMFNAVKAKGLPVALLMFEGEQHGFRRAETIRRALEAELYFYGRVFGFKPADVIDAVDIENLPMLAC
jgi:dipeptidyl aminopeptidase/acylaminoacyl peptidase